MTKLPPMRKRDGPLFQYVLCNVISNQGKITVFYFTWKRKFFLPITFYFKTNGSPQQRKSDGIRRN